MKIIEQAHIYELANKHSGSQRLIYFKDLPENKESHDGVLCQEVIRSLIDRYIGLYVQKPCYETHEIILKLREILILGEKRAFENTIRKSFAKVGDHVENLPIKKNGHLFEL